MKSLVSYFRGAVHEIKNVTWPTEAETFRLTKITVVFLLVFTLMFFASDTILKYAFQFLYSFS